MLMECRVSKVNVYMHQNNWDVRSRYSHPQQHGTEVRRDVLLRVRTVVGKKVPPTTVLNDNDGNTSDWQKTDEYRLSQKNKCMKLCKFNRPCCMQSAPVQEATRELYLDAD